ncbi:hypothetical protein MVEG_01228 [Podila verticillata NRRL 6337]|nr:hypothetical protein MVEG_01228 [Podila verticillata NRRL 6337]
MAYLQRNNPPIFQEFERADGSHARLPAQTLVGTNERYVLWSDVQDAFEDVDHLRDQQKELVLFMSDNDNGKPCRPLRIQQNPTQAYMVHCSDNSGHRVQSNKQNLVPKGLSEYFESRGKILQELYDRLGQSITWYQFQRIASNFRYYQFTLSQEMERLILLPLVDGAAHHRMLEGYKSLKKHVSELEHNLNFHYLLFEHRENNLNCAMSDLFIVLPSDLTSWNDSDTLTHQFRFYFLCAYTGFDLSDLAETPRYVHFSNHPGFGLKHPREFFQIYGDRVLKVLQMIKCRLSQSHCQAPPLTTSELLLGCDARITGGQLSTVNIGPLIDKAFSYLSYLMDLHPPPKQLKVKMNHHQSAAIKSYLEVPDGDRVEGDLCRRSHPNWNVYHWTCQAHAHSHLDRDSLSRLNDFVCNHGGHVDMHQATVKVELGSHTEAQLFLSLYEKAETSFDVSVKLNQGTSQQFVWGLRQSLAEAGTDILEIDGLTVKEHPQEPFQYISDHLKESPHPHIGEDGVFVTTLLNYPRPHEQTMYTGDCSLLTKMSSVPTWYDWRSLRKDVEQFRATVSCLQKATGYEAPARKLRSALAAHGFTDVTKVTVYDKVTIELEHPYDAEVIADSETPEYVEITEIERQWNATFDLMKGSLVELCSSEMDCPQTLPSLKSLQILTQDISIPEWDPEVHRMLLSNPQLRELNLSTPKRDVILQVEPIIQLSKACPRPFVLTLFDRIREDRGRVIVQMAFGGSNSIGIESSEMELEDSEYQTHGIKEHAQDTAMELEFLLWDCDHFFFHFSDIYASFLDSATQQHPSVLASLTLDISALSETGITCFQQVLARSDLSYLCILCTPFESALSQYIAKILQNVRWQTLRYLVLTGEHIDSWLSIWSIKSVPRLLRLDIFGSSSVLQQLSHSSVLVVHQMIYTSSLVELHLGNIHLQNRSDWPLITDDLDPSSLETLGLSQSTVSPVNHAAGLPTNNAPKESRTGRKRDERCGDEDEFGSGEWDRKKAQRIVKI